MIHRLPNVMSNPNLVSRAHKLSGVVAHDLSGFICSRRRATDETDGMATGDPEDEICRGI